MQEVPGWSSILQISLCWQLYLLGITLKVLCTSKRAKHESYNQGIAPGWGILNNYNATSNGRIWHCSSVTLPDQGYNQRPTTRLIVVYAGDFNAILSPQDRLAGASISLNDVKDFAACIQSMGVTKLQWQGDYYSWTNKQHGEDKISSKIDRVFGNYEWMEQWGHVITEYENLKCSRVNFKFFNTWAEHPSFMGLVENIWKKEYRTGQMQRVWQLNNKEFKFISQKMEKAREELNRIQEHITSQATDEQRTRKKQIRSITSLSRQMIYDPTEIQDEFVQFYKGLMGTTTGNMSAIDIQIMRRGNKQSRHQRISLCAEVIEEEIYVGLKTTGNDKALGFDGYNAFIFKRTWQTMKEEIIAAVIHWEDACPYKLHSGNPCPKSSKPKNYEGAGFIPGRKIADNIIFTHELVMTELGFPNLFTQWVMTCVKTVRYAIVVNGQTSQGDPMSPFLFSIAMEYLSRSLNGLKEDKTFKFHPKCSKLEETWNPSSLSKSVSLHSHKLQVCRQTLIRAPFTLKEWQQEISNKSSNSLDTQ
ncbi:hypothetical protein H5410_041183 [Solanum commersonii]|uniref:Reverse transcriptase domain-containing protein n=1 Tax=Solanum commersonii TaxID=4109 RepID=A0A9J5XSA2_SOLCO|nr:hypothetical protein H5410_041183 [Solanum commersonii]